MTLLLGLGVGLTWIAVQKPAPDTESLNGRSSSQIPGYYLNGATITIGGTDGTPLYQLTAERIVQQPQEETVVMSNVKFDYLEKDNSPWELIAKEGQISDDQSVVRLYGEVTLVNRDLDTGTPTVVVTDVLDILPESYVATTNEKVVITHGQYEMTAIGMAADLNLGKLQLKSDVNGHFNP